MQFEMLINTKMRIHVKAFLGFKHLDVFIMLLNVIMATIVGILTFMSRIIFIMLINVKMPTIVGISTFISMLKCQQLLAFQHL